jgi:hypothetical protein
MFYKTMKQFLLFLSFSFSAHCLFGQALLVDISYASTAPGNRKSLIFYSPNTPLSVGDFESRPDINSDAVAITSSGFAFGAGFRSAGGKATLIITVHCSFDKNKSWMKAAGKNAYILGHEQLHFDISYLAAMHFIEQLKQASFTTGNYAKLLEKTYRQSVIALEAMQHQYDTETKNGQLPDKQAAWKDKVNDLIGALNTE